MNWFKQNKFEAILLILVLLAAIGIFLFGNKKKGAYNEALERFDRANSSVQNLEKNAPYPNMANVEARKDQSEAFRKKVVDLQNLLLAYRPESFSRISPAAFTTKLNEISAKLKELYSEIEYPEDWQVGFEAYTASPPKDTATAFLSYELDAMDWLFTELAKSKPSALLNVHRKELPIENGQPMNGGDNDGSEPYHRLPVELTFRGSESTLREFLASLAGSKEYFVVVRNMRVTNSNEDPPEEDDAKFDSNAAAPVTAGGDGTFEGFEGFFTEEPEAAEEEAPAPVEEAPSGQRILGQVLGAEELNVFLHLEFLLFKDEVKLPGAGDGEGNK